MQTSDLRRTLKEVIADREFSAGQIAKMVDLSPATLSNFLAGKGPASDQTSGKLRQWLSQQGFLQWFPTRTAERIMGALAATQQRGEFCVITGDAGCGKTVTAKEFQATQKNVLYRYLNPLCRSTSVLLSTLCDLFAVGTGHSIQRSYERLLANLQDGPSSPLLILDEAQHCGPAGLETLRSLHDEAGLSVALVGNSEIHRMLSGSRDGTRTAAFAQLHSRVGITLAVQTTEDDVVEFCKHKRVPQELVPVFVSIGVRRLNGGGGLRAVGKILDAARQCASGGNLDRLAVAKGHIVATGQKLEFDSGGRRAKR